jgi:MYXO-CTERM domain-containing protein
MHALARWSLVLAALTATAVAGAQTVGQRADAAHGCDTDEVVGWGLDRQLARAQSCMFPELLAEIVPGGGLSIAGATLPFATPQTRDALYGARARGVAFQVNSAFRTVLQQYYLAVARSPACGSVATPGSSNHESGNAVDVQQYAAARSALEAHGCSWPNYTADPWHFNCPPAGAPRRTVLVLQRLWNLNHPEDRIAEDNEWGPMTQARLRASPTAGFAMDGCAPESCDRTAGRFTFSCDGANAGAHCVSINEPDDPDSWSDNFLCTVADVGLRWSIHGPVAGMRCVNVAESADSHAAAWADDYACIPSDAPFELRWSSAGPVDGWACVHFNETADRESWGDNYLCARDVSRFSAGGFTFSGSGAVEGMTCVSVDEPGDPHTWSDNYFCSTRDVGMRWSAAGPIDGMTCTQVNEPADSEAAAWEDNHLCLPVDAAYGFVWSTSGPVAGMTCVRWYEGADLAGTWDDNYLCVREIARPVDAGVADGGLVGIDAGVVADAGVDAGTARDAGVDAGVDAGIGADLGDDAGGADSLSAGCGCRVGARGGSGWLGAWALAGLAVRARRRRRP